MIQNPNNSPYRCCTHYREQGYDEGYLMLPIFRVRVCCNCGECQAVWSWAAHILTLEVNSGGGNMFAGYEIYTILKAATIPTEVEIQSLAGSAMSVAAIGADVVRASPVAQFMIHLPSLRTEGDSTEHERSLQALSSFKASERRISSGPRRSESCDTVHSHSPALLKTPFRNCI